MQLIFLTFVYHAFLSPEQTVEDAYVDVLKSSRDRVWQAYQAAFAMSCFFSDLKQQNVFKLDCSACIVGK